MCALGLVLAGDLTMGACSQLPRRTLEHLFVSNRPPPPPTPAPKGAEPNMEGKGNASAVCVRLCVFVCCVFFSKISRESVAVKDPAVRVPLF